MYSFNDSQLDYISDNLVAQGYVIVDDFFPQEVKQSLLNHFNQMQMSEFKMAGVGRQDQFQLAEAIRSDEIYWLSAGVQSVTMFLDYMESLRVGINQRLFFGLFDYESHFARYKAGAFYKKHLDVFRGNNERGKANRVLSTVFYLNENWAANNGGELLIYAKSGETVLEKVLPVCGRLVIFLSEIFPHEVLPANRERKSIAGWFRVNQ